MGNEDRDSGQLFGENDNEQGTADPRQLTLPGFVQDPPAQPGLFEP